MAYKLKYQTKLLLLFLLLSIIPLICVLLINFYDFQYALKETIGSKFLDTAVQTIEKIDTELRKTETDIQAWAQNSIMQDALADDTDGRITEFLKELKIQYGQFSGLFCFNLNGVVIASSEEETLGADVEELGWFKEALQTDKPKIFPLALRKLAGGYSVRVSVPIMASFESSQKIGLLVVDVNWSEYFDIINSIKVDENGQSESGFALLIDKDGVIISGPDFTIEEELLFEKTLDIYGFRFQQKALKGERNYLLTFDSSGKEWLVGYAGSQGIRGGVGLGWSVVVVQEKDQAFLPVYKLLYKLLEKSFFILFATVLIVLVLSYSVAKTITLPIRNLMDLTHRIAKGGFDQRITLRRRDEFGQLAESFNTMTETLQQTTVSKEYMNNILESMAETLVVVDRKGMIVTANSSLLNLLGYSEQELLNRNFKDILWSSELNLDKGVWLEKLLREGALRNYEVDYKTRSNEKIPISFSSSVMKDTNTNEIVGIVGVGRDIRELKRLMQREKELLERATQIEHKKAEELAAINKKLEQQIVERKQLEEQLLQSQKMEAIGQMAGGIAHDFNNQLTVINGYCELLLNSLEKGSENYHNAEEIYKAGEHSAKLTQQLLAYGRRQMAIPKKINLNDFISSMSDIWSRLLGEKIDLKISLEESLALVKVDSAQIEQVLVQLIINARDAMPDGGDLTIETKNVELDAEYEKKHLEVTAGEYVLITVSDSGMGMDKDVMKHIFEPFFTTKGKEKHSGLGLATSYGIVKQNEGHISVYSEPDIGTTLKIYLPKLKEEKKEDVSSLKKEVSTQGNETVLVVEDETSLRDLAVNILKNKGYNVLSAEEGVSALKVAEKHSGTIDLLLTDMIMPKMGGRELKDKITNLFPNIKVLFMSGYTDESIDRHGLMKAKIKFIQKPFTVKNLSQKIREVLDS